MKKIKWSQVKPGDVFPDGSVVMEVRPWSNEVSYEIEMNGNTLIASKDHLLKSVVRKNGHIINNQIMRSLRIRNDIGIDEDTWLCLEDINLYWQISHNLDEDQYEVFLLDENGNDMEIGSITKSGAKKVRCITTSTGQYAIGGFVNHNTGGKNMDDVSKRAQIIETYDAWGSSKIVQDMAAAKTTEEAREICFQGLKEEYRANGIELDDYNLKVMAKKLTSYKRDKKEGTRYVRDGEKCSIMSVSSIGNFSNPFKAAELQSGYKILTNAGEFELLPDAANEIIF